ncbi:MAG: hypothetical protein JO094_14445 [Hyphomicrobiales bacterium]|nr:hypothetical protein [Hyphomicrobiales bacterium]MBV8770083.1 hypothetical protein [Hyphomicrobiales bacterium]MBV9588815.1 hypothetical protein [Hyphomicrobiales bacterium]MBV9974884.1 hypothetical protein [Hyphomicrobiales bacterium]
MARAFDPETVKIVSVAYESAWREIEAALAKPMSKAKRTETSAALTRELLAAVEAGERDPDKLRTIALSAMRSR